MIQYVQCPCCTSLLEIDECGLAREVSWYELLDWQTLPDVFEKLPTEIKNKIRVALSEGSDWTPKKEEVNP